MSDVSADGLLLGADERGFYIRARGAIRARLCYPLREGLLSRLEERGDVPQVFVDLSECAYMDSTFIGLLVATDKRLRRTSGGRLHVLRPSPACREILSQIGLENYLLVEDKDVPPPPEMAEVVPEPGRPGADFVLKAHEALMETSEEARRKFGLLKEMLEKKLRSEKPPKDIP